MSRCRFVQPEVVRLTLVDVHKRALQKLEATTPTSKADKAKKAEDLIALQAALAAAEEDGHFIDVKQQLTAGEQRRMFAGMARDLTPGEKVMLNPELVGRTKISAYLVGWSLTDFEGKPVPVSDSAIDNLDTDTYAEIVQAIDAHETAVDEARAERKNVQSGESKSSATSPSAGI